MQTVVSVWEKSLSSFRSLMLFYYNHLQLFAFLCSRAVLTQRLSIERFVWCYSHVGQNGNFCIFYYFYPNLCVNPNSGWMKPVFFGGEPLVNSLWDHLGVALEATKSWYMVWSSPLFLVKRLLGWLRPSCQLLVYVEPAWPLVYPPPTPLEPIMCLGRFSSAQVDATPC